METANKGGDAPSDLTRKQMRMVGKSGGCVWGSLLSYSLEPKKIHQLEEQCKPARLLRPLLPAKAHVLASVDAGKSPHFTEGEKRWRLVGIVHTQPHSLPEAWEDRWTHAHKLLPLVYTCED